MHISCIFVHIRRTKFMYISFPSPSTIYVKTIKEAVYWWDAFLSTVIKRKDYTYAAISPQHTSFIKAIVGNSKLMDLCSSNVLLMGTTYWGPKRVYLAAHTILGKSIKEVVYWWDTSISTVIKRKDYTYTATSGHEEQRSIVLPF